MQQLLSECTTSGTTEQREIFWMLSGSTPFSQSTARKKAQLRRMKPGFGSFSELGNQIIAIKYTAMYLAISNI